MRQEEKLIESAMNDKGVCEAGPAGPAGPFGTCMYTAQMCPTLTRKLRYLSPLIYH